MWLSSRQKLERLVELYVQLFLSVILLVCQVILNVAKLMMSANRIEMKKETSEN